MKLFSWIQSVVFINNIRTVPSPASRNLVKNHGCLPERQSGNYP